MGTVMLDDRTHQRIRLLANVLGVDEGKAVALLVDQAEKERSPAVSPEVVNAVVPIHAVYRGQRVEAEYDPATRSIKVRSGPLEDAWFATPSRAAIEVVESIAPTVSPNRNGWGFWIVTATGQPLQSIRNA